MQRVTIKDLAEHLGLSTSTVARALANQADVRGETRDRVLRAADALGYVAHSGARLMRAGSASMVGLIVPDIQNDFYATVAKAMAECCNDAGLQLVLAVTEDDRKQEYRQVRALVEARAAGIIIVPSPRPMEETLTLLEQQPVVQFIRYLPALAADWFGIDERHAIGQAIDYLLGLGHRRIAYIGARTSTSTGRERLAGYRETLAAAGIVPDEALIHTGAPRASAACEATAICLSLEDRPTAIVAGGARITLGMLQAVHEFRLSVPTDVSVIGFGDAPWSAWYHDGLTTIGLPVRDIALNCGSFLIRRIQEEPSNDAGPRHPFHAASQARLIVRRSCAGPASR
ncbi:MAG: LacI family DNA-binding transcriptional regulator [Azospirillaceae bacterium]